MRIQALNQVRCACPSGQHRTPQLRAPALDPHQKPERLRVNPCLHSRSRKYQLLGQTCHHFRKSTCPFLKRCRIGKREHDCSGLLHAHEPPEPPLSVVLQCTPLSAARTVRVCVQTYLQLSVHIQSVRCNMRGITRIRCLSVVQDVCTSCHVSAPHQSAARKPKLKTEIAHQNLISVLEGRLEVIDKEVAVPLR
jgi:hypothetical protein